MIAIPNMDKPKYCGGCPCENDKNCQALDILKGECRENPTSSILTWSACPLIEIDEQILETAIKLAKLNRTMAEVEANEDKYIESNKDFCSYGEREGE